MPIWVIYAVLAAVAAAIVGILSKLGIKGVDATLATSIRGLVIGLFMGGAAFFLGEFKNIGTIPAKSLLFIALAGVAGGLSWLWGFLALKYGGDVTAVNAIDRMSLILLVLLAALFAGEALTWAKAAGAVLVVFGVILLTMKAEEFVRLTLWVKQLF
jgi:transporter family protein